MIEIRDYEVKKPLGEGGMATVYLAIHKRLQREIALKVMSPAVSATKGFEKSLLSEGRIIAKLDHPNIVKIYDIDSQNGYFYMSMEVLHKGNLKQRLGNGRLPISNALRVTAQIANALSYAHRKGCIHRDIKPANIMFRKDGAAVLTDFGIAKVQGVTSEMTQMGYIAGTPYYMAPEQARGSLIDQRADIYSLGVVFYEMLTGMKPFTGSNTVAITYEHAHGSIPKLEGENTVFQEILDTALAKKAEDRFNTAEEFSEALYKASQADPETLLMTSAFSTDELVTNKQPAWSWIIALAVIGISSIMATYYYSKSTEEARIVAEQEKLDIKIADDKTKEIQQQQHIIATDIKNHISLAKIRDEKRRLFDHSGWSKGCKHYLEDMDGPYEAKDSSEWHYHEVLLQDAKHPIAKEKIDKINKIKLLEFKGCDNYQRTIEKDPLEALFK
jgi:serine/threonine protein kinase